MSTETIETPAETIARLAGTSPAPMTWEDIRAIAEHEMKHRDFLSAGLDLVDDAEIAEWNRWTETHRAWHERDL